MLGTSYSVYYPCSIVLRQIFCQFTGSAAQTHCARHPQLVSKKFLEEEIFVGTNFRELAFDHENRKNFCLAKISCYTVCVSLICAHFSFWSPSLSFASLPPFPILPSSLFLSSLLFLSFPVALFLSPPRIRQAAASINLPPPSSVGAYSLVVYLHGNGCQMCARVCVCVHECMYVCVCVCVCTCMCNWDDKPWVM